MSFTDGQILTAAQLNNYLSQFLSTGSLQTFMLTLLQSTNLTTAQGLFGLGPYATMTSIPTPTNPTDPANKAYVDSVAQGLDVKPSALVATTANITLSGEQTIDGVLTSASIVLVKNQTTTNQNGLYVSASGAWTRVAQMNTWAQVPGAFVFVEQGTANADTGWVCTSDAGGVIGTTAIAWSKFTNVAGSLQASNNLSDLVSVSTALTNLGAGATGVSLFQAGSAATATALLNVMAASTKGLVPAPSASPSASKFLTETGTFAVPATAAPTKHTTVLTSGTTWTSNANHKFATITVIGGGGAGGGASSNAQAGSGGGAGGIAIKTYVLAPSTAYTIAIGAGATATTGTGGTGGTTTFTDGTTLISGLGGVGGVTTSTATVFGGVGGTATNGDINIAGQWGTVAHSSSWGAGTVAGDGASGMYGVGGRGVIVNASAGNAGTGFGAGGGGGWDATAAQNGGAGAQGAIIIEEWY